MAAPYRLRCDSLLKQGHFAWWCEKIDLHHDDAPLANDTSDVFIVQVN